MDSTMSNETEISTGFNSSTASAAETQQSSMNGSGGPKTKELSTASPALPNNSSPLPQEEPSLSLKEESMIGQQPTPEAGGYNGDSHKVTPPPTNGSIPASPIDDGGTPSRTGIVEQEETSIVSPQIKATNVPASSPSRSLQQVPLSSQPTPPSLAVAQHHDDSCIPVSSVTADATAANGASLSPSSDVVSTQMSLNASEAVSASATNTSPSSDLAQQHDPTIRVSSEAAAEDDANTPPSSDVVQHCDPPIPVSANTSEAVSAAGTNTPPSSDLAQQHDPTIHVSSEAATENDTNTPPSSDVAQHHDPAITVSANIADAAAASGSGEPPSSDATQHHDPSIPVSAPHHNGFNKECPVELIDDDKEVSTAPPPSASVPIPSISATHAGVKRKHPDAVGTKPSPAADDSISAYQRQHLGKAISRIVPGASLSTAKMQEQQPPQKRVPNTPEVRVIASAPQYMAFPPGFTPFWTQPLPSFRPQNQNQSRAFELSLINVKEFTITGLAVGYASAPTPISGLRKTIKEISKEFGKASFERDTGKEAGEPGRWKIPLGAYQALYTYLNRDPNTRVIGIAANQLQIASLGKAILEKGYPSPQKLVKLGVPKGLSIALAPFQRGGVDFVHEKEGRALIADEMGLGKTVQAIASMAIYHEEWPILVLTPSSARYHWENEFQQWLGKNSKVNNSNGQPVNLGAMSEENDEAGEADEEYDESNCMPLLSDQQIHVLSSSKDPLLPNDSVKVVVCSYGLAPMLVESKKLYPKLFKCAIVDESHMLKNCKSKRTKALVPVLAETTRCVLLSGTPALARPMELWPQLKILGTVQHGWGDSEDEFVSKYVKRSSAVRRAELHTMLTGTIMIRRLKHDILKSLPNKMREKGIIDVVTESQKQEFHNCMLLLRQGKGVMGRLARQHSAAGSTQDIPAETNTPGPGEDAKNEAICGLRAEYESQLSVRRQHLQLVFMQQHNNLNDGEQRELFAQLESNSRRELDAWYQERLHGLQEQVAAENQLSRKNVLNKMYTLTGKTKTPLIADMIKKWLADPTKGKLCVFAHHLFCLDELVSKAGLSNAKGSTSQFIRIDGSTSPKTRQAEIKTFQNNPNVRIAILGITAAGVAVTLTAASTVWFAELFWTPALMIQAEDRCHRIGQNARVRCLYFVASGTLDDLLWKLLEKKFQDLGEFVEGEEKMKIVVHKQYNGSGELFGLFRTDDELLSDEDSKGLENLESENQESGILNLEQELQSDIQELVQEELIMAVQDDEDDDGMKQSKVAAMSPQNDTFPVVQGSTEDDAIMLSDDEEENATSSGAAQNTANATFGSSKRKRVPFDLRAPLQQSRIYSMIFEGTNYGISLSLYQGRVVIGRNVSSNSKPAVGDVLIAMNGRPFPFNCQLNEVTVALKKAIVYRSTVELTFLECPGFTVQYHEQLVQHEKREAAARAAQLAKSSESVIELLDDD